MTMSGNIHSLSEQVLLSPPLMILLLFIWSGPGLHVITMTPEEKLIPL